MQSRSTDSSSDLLALLVALPGFSGYRFNPQALVKAVNRLRHSGGEVALEILRAYDTLAEKEPGLKPENALLVARILFTSRDARQRLPRLLLGQPDIAEPDDPTLLPLFPLYLCDGLPLLLVGGYLLGGETEPPSQYLDWCERNGAILPGPLKPDDDPLANVEVFLESDTAKSLNLSDAQKGMLRWQSLQAISSAGHILERGERDILLAARSDERWNKYREEFASLRMRWNPETDEYDQAGLG